KAVGLRAVLAVPLLARGEALGALLTGFFEQDRRYGSEEVALAQDLAQRAAMAVDAARLYGEAQRAVRLREDFLTIAGHELKTPLTALHLQIQGVLRKLARGETRPEDLLKMRRSAEVAEKQVHRLTA